MEQQVCQFQTVSTKGFTPKACARNESRAARMVRSLSLQACLLLRRHFSR